MKFCSKCGNELSDNALYCSKCGCTVENNDKTTQVKDNSKVQTAFILNIIALIISVLATFTLLSLDLSGEYYYDVSLVPFKYAKEDPATAITFGSLAFLVIVSFVFSLITKKKVSQQENGTRISQIYFVITLIVDAVYIILAPKIFIYFICGVGILIPIPPVLQTISAIKFMRAVK